METFWYTLMIWTLHSVAFMVYLCIMGQHKAVMKAIDSAMYPWQIPFRVYAYIRSHHIKRGN